MISLISQVIDKVITILTFMIIIRSFLSFLPQFRSNQLSRILDDVTDPLLKPFQRLQIGGKAMAVDFSPIFAIIALNVIGWLIKMLLSLFY
ncbi:MAG TPA: YggT family protein [Desulfosporosinus sp.]